MIVLRISPRFLFHFETAIPHCSATFMSAPNVTPKSFSCVVLPSTAFPILYIFVHVSMSYVYAFISEHLTDLSRSSCNLCLSVSFVIILNTLVSSANFSTCHLPNHLCNIKNSVGPNTDPCGTPLKIDFQFEISPSTITLCLLCVSHFSIQLITSLPIP